MKHLRLFIPFFLATALSAQNIQPERLAAYEGVYEYIDQMTLEIVASGMDSTLYAVIDQAKYPLTFREADSFANVQHVPVVFNRDSLGKVISYTTGGQTFRLLTRDFKRMEMYPRKEQFANPESYVYQQPAETTDGLKTGHLSDVFDNPEPLIRMVTETIKGNYPDVHSILIYKNGRLVLEEYFYGYDKNMPHQLRSATKPFIGALIGICTDTGLIGSESDLLLPYFKEKYPDIANPDARKLQITVEDFLTYRHGLDCANNNPESKGYELAMMESGDWVKFTLDLPVTGEPGSHTSYCSGCALTLGSLVEQVTGTDIESFAQEHLFGPLGIENYKWTFQPDPSQKASFSQMYLTPRDLVKLAKMYLDGGSWNGRQILSRAWVDKTFRSDTGEYGYLWEHKFFDVEGRRYHSYLASGNGGQKINIWPELDMITVFTGGSYNAYQLYGRPTPPNEMIPQYILQSLE